jgi:hypothetical protein
VEAVREVEGQAEGDHEDEQRHGVRLTPLSGS